VAKKRKVQKPKSDSRLSTILWMIVTVISGGGVSGYLNPDLPLVGSIVKSLNLNPTGAGSAPSDIHAQQEISNRNGGLGPGSGLILTSTAWRRLLLRIAYRRP
jgi:hypothetical protein